jgi:uncharacterized MAPEG superfamily protein
VRSLCSRAVSFESACARLCVFFLSRASFSLSLFFFFFLRARLFLSPSLSFSLARATRLKKQGHKNKKEFDCVQRAHQNTLEVAPSVASSTMMVGLMHPITSAALCGIWSLGRVVYVLGYGTGNPANRRTGGLIAHLGDIPLFVMTFVVGYKMLQ